MHTHRGRNSIQAAHAQNYKRWKYERRKKRTVEQICVPKRSSKIILASIESITEKQGNYSWLQFLDRQLEQA
jgi:hypothetical protein